MAKFILYIMELIVFILTTIGLINVVLWGAYRAYAALNKLVWESELFWARLKMYQLKNRYTGVEDKQGQHIKQGDVLKTPEGCYCTVIFEELSFAVESLGSYAVDYEKPEFYTKCEIVANINKNPHFYEQLEGGVK